MNFFNKFTEGTYDDFALLFKNTKVIHVLSNSDEKPESYFKNLANSCGITLIYEEDPITGEIKMNHWTEIRFDPEKIYDTYKHSNKSQPLHTDYGYFSFEIFAAFFYCVNQADFGGATTFVDVDVIVRMLKEVNQPLFEELQSQKILFGRNANPIACNEDYILQKDSLGWKINWNYYRALNDNKNKVLIEDFKDFLDHYIEKSGELMELKLQPNEGVFFQDRRVLHGRNSFLGQRQLNKGGIAKNIPDFVQKFLNESK